MLVDDRYALEAKLGEGAMGRVYRAWDVELDRMVALKLVTGDHAQGSVALQRVRREARALAAVTHPSVASVHTIGSHQGGYYFVMEYVEGTTLEELIEAGAKRGRPMPAEDALGILRRIASGLGAAHACGVLHRDVKPSNIVIETRTSRPVLVDFGLACREKHLEPDDVHCGTPLYMAPELGALVPSQPPSVASDIYALGCTALELLTGRDVFAAETIQEVFYMHAFATPPALADVAPELRALVGGALEKDPRNRTPSCEAFVDAIDAVLLELATCTPSRPTNDDAPATPRLRVLVVSADRDSRGVVESLMSCADVASPPSVIVAATGAEALEAFEAAPASVVVLEAGLAGMSGIDTVHMLRMLPGGNRARVVMVAEGLTASEERTLAELGVCHVATRPRLRTLIPAVVHEVRATVRVVNQSARRSLVSTAVTS